MLPANRLHEIATPSLLTIPSDIVDLDDEEQLADVARRFIVPMLQPPGG